MNQDGRILIVDDEPGIRDICSRTLKQMGFEVESAPDGQAALRRLNDRRFDLVLTDLAMPQPIHGARLTQEIKGGYPYIDVIIMTAHPSLETAIPTLRSGVYDYLIKPFHQELLRAVIARCFEKRRLSKELDQEKLLRQELEAAYLELQKVEQLKEAILSRLTHELRSPVSTSLMALEAFDVRSGDEKLSRAMRSNLTRLQETIEELLLFAELSHGPNSPRRRPVDLKILINDVVRHHRLLWEDRRLDVKVEWAASETSLRADPDLLTTAFKHLLLNAIRFNTQDGRIFIRGYNRPDGICISFSDTGTGIPREKLPRVFDGFYQAAAYLSRNVGGLGLGLAIVRRIIEAHGGAVGVESEEGKGSVFTVRLPAQVLLRHAP